MSVSAPFSFGGTVSAALFIALVTSGGCSGDDSTPPRSGATCEQACAQCSVTDICGDCAGAATRFRDEFEDALYACVLRQTTCTHDWEKCVSEAVATLPPRDLDPTFRATCLAKRTDCQNQGAGFADDLCLTSGAFTIAIVTEAQQCLSKACAEISACLNAAFR